MAPPGRSLYSTTSPWLNEEVALYHARIELSGPKPRYMERAMTTNHESKWKPLIHASCTDIMYKYAVTTLTIVNYRLVAVSREVAGGNMKEADNWSRDAKTPSRTHDGQ